MPCGYKKEMDNYKNIESIKCEELVNKTFPCGHLKEMKYCKDTKSI